MKLIGVLIPGTKSEDDHLKYHEIPSKAILLIPNAVSSLFNLNPKIPSFLLNIAYLFSMKNMTQRSGY